MSPLWRLFLFASHQTIYQLILVILCMALAISFVLSNVGLMDGYEKAFKQGLKESGADIQLQSTAGFFFWDLSHEHWLQKIVPKSKSIPIILSEAFAVGVQTAKGIQLRGVDDHALGFLGLKKIPQDHEIFLGKILAEALGVKVGQTIQLLFSQGNSLASGLPQARSFVIAGLVEHQLHLRDERTAYVHRDTLATLVGAGTKVNQVLIRCCQQDQEIEKQSLVITQALNEREWFDLWVKPFWSEHHNLMEAVAVEKMMITIALQLVVIVSLFNIVSFLYELFTHRQRELFLLRTLGISFRQLTLFFFLVVTCVWGLALIGALALTYLFDWLLQTSSWLEIPGKIYELGRLSLSLSVSDVLWCSLGALFWTWLITGLSLWRLKKQSLTQVLRGELA